jgi:FMNH2-dependent dimethyl sulfone monooxygenase
MTFSTAPERWECEWDDIVEVSKLADDAGIEFVLPVGKWRGFGGPSRLWDKSYEVIAHSAAIAAVTKRIGVFSTVHTPLLSPAYAAKAITTIDHISHGRAGLNIVCGWNQDEFDIHGVKIDGEKRYDHGLEWYRIYAKLMAGGEPFDWDGEFFQLKHAFTDPLPYQRPRPAVMSAGVSNKGRDFAAQAADILFTNAAELALGKQMTDSVRGYAAKHDRNVDVYASCVYFCRPTRKEAEDFYYYIAEENADRETTSRFKKKRIATATDGEVQFSKETDVPPIPRHDRAMGKLYSGLIPGVYPLVGSPDDIVEELQKLSSIGIAGSSLAFVNYKSELPLFVQEVLPRMQRVGLRD